MRTLIFLFTLVNAAALAQTSAPLANDELLHSARMWEAHDRGDLAQLALEKLIAARPDSPDALLALGELHLRTENMSAAARVLEQLQTRFKNSAATRSFEAEYRFATSERLQLASVQRLIQIGQSAQARAALDRLFPQGPPTGALGLQYYGLLANTPNGWQRAYEGLKKLAADHPDDPRYRLALARQLIRREPTALEGMQALNALAKRDDVRAAEVDDALAGAMKDAGYERVPGEILRDYLARHPKDTDARSALTQNARASEESELLSRNALAAIEPELQQRLLRELETNLRARGAQANRAGDLLKLLRGELPGDSASIDDPIAAAALWRERGRQSVVQNRELATAEIEAALAFVRQNYEAEIEIANRLESLGANNLSGELLAMASRLDATSSWLFESRVRWLINHAREDEALSLLDRRAPDQNQNQKWTAETRDALRAAALDQRAQRAMTSGNNAQALFDLETAVRLAPRNPWPRYRLAGLYAKNGDVERGRQLMLEGVQLEPGNTEMRYAQALYLSSLDDYADALAAVNAIAPSERSAGVNELQERLRSDMARAEISNLRRSGDLDAAAQRLDALLAANPNDRSLRIARADLELAAGRPKAARDRYAALAAEAPEDLDTRLSYVRALTESGDLALARLQLQGVQERVAADDVDTRLGIARRQLALNDSNAAVQTLEPILSSQPARADVLLLAGRAELAQRHFAQAHDYFERAERTRTEPDAATARLAREAIDARLQNSMAAGFEVRHKSGDAGLSQFDSILIPTSWQFARNYEQRISLRADAVTVDAGSLSSDFNSSALLGKIQAAGPAAARPYSNSRQNGLSLGLGYITDNLTADIGTTPLGFLLPNIVGGVEWTPEWKSLDLTLGLARRAVTSSVLSYAGLRDPVSGEKWGGVVESGSYAGFGLYRERYSVSGSLRLAEFTGTQVLDNRFVGARAAADWKLLSRTDANVFVGLTLNYWNYRHNLQNYTFGSGGYYSPHSYLSVALPVELQGVRNGWSYRLRASISHSTSDIERTAFYPKHAALQNAAMNSTLPSGYDEAYFSASHGSGTSLSAYAAVERQISRAFVLGAKLDLDRADYYRPTILSLYFRHAFAPWSSSVATPPEPVRLYNDL